MKSALTIFVAIMMAVFGWFATPGLGLSGADLTDPPIAFLLGTMVFVSCLIWLAAPHFLRNRTSTAWILYGIASPLMGGLLVSIAQAVFIIYAPFALIYVFFAALVTIPVGLLTSFIVYLIWKRPDWERAEQGADDQMPPAPILKRKGRSNIDVEIGARSPEALT
jgi:hypothetical protein